MLVTERSRPEASFSPRPVDCSPLVSVPPQVSYVTPFSEEASRLLRTVRTAGWYPHPVSASHPLNVPGDYYVEKDCCTLCGVPWNLAPELFAYDDTGCWVARQPAGSGEERKMLQVIDAQELGCVRYRGTKPLFLRVAKARILNVIRRGRA